MKRKVNPALFLLIILGFSQSQADSWEKHRSSLEGLSHRVRSLEEEIEGLVSEKNKSRDPEKTSELLGMIVEKHKELTESHRKFREESEHVKYSHPGQGKQFDVKYRHGSVKPLEEFDKKTGMEGLIKEFHQTVDSAYMSPQLKQRRDEVFQEKFEKENPANKVEKPGETNSRPKLKL
ncbi:MAG: hypothetical protein COT74_05255 [Bdellovibrionales bacterium CG10_big_fil_rev_8_21_14_0_10_45_34]|nr:MAG: hypothetical protein COT74_05255 [Bdellovibrionales bacterium CG10_big_fil_rev_8_21_14_0_10_45_34]